MKISTTAFIGGEFGQFEEEIKYNPLLDPTKVIFTLERCLPSGRHTSLGITWNVPTTRDALKESITKELREFPIIHLSPLEIEEILQFVMNATEALDEEAKRMTRYAGIFL